MVSMASELKARSNCHSRGRSRGDQQCGCCPARPSPIDRAWKLVVGHQPDGADPRRIVADRAQAEADLIIVRKAPLIGGRPLRLLGIPARIGQIPFVLGAVLWIRPIDPGDHDIDSILGANHVEAAGRGTQLFQVRHAFGEDLADYER
jgi:hypothetical protein